MNSPLYSEKLAIKLSNVQGIFIDELELENLSKYLLKFYFS